MIESSSAGDLSHPIVVNKPTRGRRLAEFRSLSFRQIDDVIIKRTGAAAFDIGGTLIKCVL